MKSWQLYEAQSQLSEIVKLCAQEPQMIYENTKPLGIVVDTKFFQELMALWSRHHPTIAELLDELDGIRLEETVDIEIPARVDREVTIGAISDKFSL